MMSPRWLLRVYTGFACAQLLACIAKENPFTDSTEKHAPSEQAPEQHLPEPSYSAELSGAGAAGAFADDGF
jgi:hypothetical protein